MRSIHRFDLSVPAGPVWLDLPCEAPGQGLQQARAWAAALPVLSALEAWWGFDLPRPTPVSASGAKVGELRLPFAPGSALDDGALWLSWSVMPLDRPPPATLPLHWPQVQAQMCLQTLPCERLAAEGLVPGAVLLLPAAFAPHWAVHLQAIRAADAAPPPAWRASARWSPSEGLVFVHGKAATCEQTATGAPWSVWLVPPFEVDMRAWLGGSAVPAHAAAGLAELRLGEQPVAWGRLLPCGSGWALRLDRVAIAETASAWT